MENVFVAVVTSFCGLLCWVIKEMWTDHKTTRKTRKILMRSEIRNLYLEYTSRGWITVCELGEFREIFELYVASGGNGTAKTMAEAVEKLERR